MQAIWPAFHPAFQLDFMTARMQPDNEADLLVSVLAILHDR